MLVPVIVYRAGEQPRTSVEKILPGPLAGLWVNLNRNEFRSFDDAGRVRRVPGAMLAGPTSQACVIEFEEGHAHISAMFALGAAGRFLAGPAAQVRDELVPLDTVRDRVLEATNPERALEVMEDILRERLTGVADIDPVIRHAARALSRGTPVAAVAEEFGLLPRTLHRRFIAEVGLSPKRFARVRRLSRVAAGLDGARKVDWAATAAEHGYSDQPHLADEFRELAGVTPGEYLRSRIDGPNHLRAELPSGKPPRIETTGHGH
jgi:AraC-like DNA-binding protein